MCLPGVLAVRGPPYPAERAEDVAATWRALRRHRGRRTALDGFPLVVLVDDSDFAARSLNNLLWVTFTRSNPAADVHGVGAFVAAEALGLPGPLVIDARIKPHHAPPLEEDPAVTPARRRAGRAAAGRCTGSFDARARCCDSLSRGPPG